MHMFLNPIAAEYNFMDLDTPFYSTYAGVKMPRRSKSKMGGKVLESLQST